MRQAGFSYAKKGLIVRVLYLAIALLFFLSRRLLGRRGGVVVLCYHSVTTRQREAFERQMRHICDRVVPLDRVEDASDDDNMVVVTFDDAFQCLLDNVIPIARNLHVPFAVFAVTGNFGALPAWLAGSGHPDADLPTMSADQIIQLGREPDCLVGSHSELHRRLGDLPLAEVEAELVSSRKTIAALLGAPCHYLAFPHGSYNQKVVDLAVRHGYRRVLTLDEVAAPSRWKPGTVGRFSVSPDMWLIEFMLTVRGAYSWLYVWRRWLRRIRWVFAGVHHVD